MHVGDKFASFQELQDAVHILERETNSLFVRKDSLRAKSPELAETLVYDRVVFECKQGRERKPEGTGQRPNQKTIKLGCKAKVRAVLRRQDDKWFLVITYADLDHDTHDASAYEEISKQDVHCEYEYNKDFIVKRRIQTPESSQPNTSAPAVSFTPSKTTTTPAKKKLKVCQPTKRTPYDEILSRARDRLGGPREDEHDAFAKTVAYKMRKLTQDQCLYAEKLINDILFEARFGNLSRSSYILTAGPSGANSVDVFHANFVRSDPNTLHASQTNANNGETDSSEHF